MAVKTRAMKIKSLSRKRSYRRRLKKSPCRGKKPNQCRSMSNCKYTSGNKRKFCRKSKNTVRHRQKGGGPGLRAMASEF
jgi:tRNA G37 N-methylase TrmD|tara:strand:- start:6866 stop:7102 length:237 start_codon:yes stop_codon:yes gene_type:complete